MKIVAVNSVDSVLKWRATIRASKICALTHEKTHELKLSVPNSFMQWSLSRRVRYLVHVGALRKEITC